MSKSPYDIDEWFYDYSSRMAKDPDSTQPHLLTQEEIDAIFEAQKGKAGWIPDAWFDVGEPVKPSEPRCECGAEKTWGADTNLHSYWCVKFKKWK